MRISDWSSDVCSSDLVRTSGAKRPQRQKARLAHTNGCNLPDSARTCRMGARLRRFPRYVNCQAQRIAPAGRSGRKFDQQEQNTSARSEEHTSELQSLMRNSYAVFCLKKKYLIHIIEYKTKHKSVYNIF